MDEHPEAEPLPVPAPHRDRHDLRQELVELLKMVALFLVLFWGLKSFVIEGYEVQGPSMLPTLEDRERILVLKFPHLVSQWTPFRGFSSIDDGDIVVFQSNVENNKRYIKRVVAKGPPGRGVRTAVASPIDGADGGVEVSVERGVVFVNNHRLNESAYLAEETVWDRERAAPVQVGPGEYYVLGDHRNISRDSRSFGTVQHEQIVGKAVLRFWPLNKIGLL